MRQKTLAALVSGFVFTIFTFVLLWQLVAITLLIQAMTGVLGLL